MSDGKEREEIDDEAFRILCTALDLAWAEIEEAYRERLLEAEKKIISLTNIASTLNEDRKSEIREILQKEPWEVCAVELCRIADEVGVGCCATRAGGSGRFIGEEFPVKRVRDAIAKLKQRLF